MNYLSRPPPRAEEIVMKRMNMKLMIKRGVSNKMPKVPIKIIGANVNRIKFKTMQTTIQRVTMSEIATIIVTTTSIGKTMAT